MPSSRLQRSATASGVIARAALVAAAVGAPTLLLSLAFPALGNPVALVIVPAVAVGLSLVKSRLWRLGLGVAASLAFLVVAWAAIQPSYI